jgi:hypothetical protein
MNLKLIYFINLFQLYNLLFYHILMLNHIDTKRKIVQMKTSLPFQISEKKTTFIAKEK